MLCLIAEASEMATFIIGSETLKSKPPTNQTKIEFSQNSINIFLSIFERNKFLQPLQVVQQSLCRTV